MRLVLDTNVLVSALLFRGQAAELHQRWKTGRFSLVVSREILLEYARVLAYPKFRLDEATVAALLHQEVTPFADLVLVPPGARVCRDPDDDKFLWCASSSGANLLVTGDDDLLTLGPSWEGVRILTLKDAILLTDGQPL